MTKFKVKLCTLLATLFVACVMCGVCMFTFADGAAAAAVDENGWNTQITRGDAQADGGHTLGNDGFSTYTDLQDGDVITFGSKFTSKKLTDIVRTAPWRISINAEGTGSVTWTLSADSKPVFSGTWTLGGSTLSASTGLKGISNVKTLAAGQTLDLLFDGNHKDSGGGVYYVNADGSLARIGGGETDATAWNNAGKPEEYDLTVTVSGEVSQVSVKAGEGLLFQCCDGSWTWLGYNDGFKAVGDASMVSGIKKSDNSQPNLFDYFVFKGYQFKFYFTQGDAASDHAYVTVGGVRVDSDKKAGADIYAAIGYYSYTVPQSATDATFKVEMAEHTVTYMNGEEKLLDAYIKGGDKAYDKDFAIAGKRITGWYTDAALQNAFDFGTALSADQTLYAKTVDVLVVNFKDSEGNILSFKNVDKDEAVAQPADPVKAGMTFMGWYTAADGKTEYDFTKAITANTDVYAIFANNVTAKVLGFNGGEQAKVVPVMAGGKLTEDMLPSFAEITGFPAYSNIELVWYTDATMAEKVNFGTDGILIESGVAYVAAVKDKDIEVANGYVRPNADGWDRNRSGGKDADGNTLTANQTLASNSKYGSAEAIKSADGYSEINIDYVGYIANTRRFDVTKDVYLSYTLDSKNESANDKDEQGNPAPKHDQKYLFVGMYNSLTGALINQGQIHEKSFGTFAAFGHRVNTAAQADENKGGGKLDIISGGASEKNSFVYEEGKPVDLKIAIGTENTKIYQLKDNAWVEIATMNVNRNMFPDGMYLAMETTRITWLSARAAQISTVTKGAETNGTFTIDTPDAGTGLLSGERVYFTATPAQGFKFSEDGVYAGDTKLTVGYDEAKESYYFNMPFGASAVTVKFALPVTFTADGKEVNEKLFVLAGEVIDEFDVTDAPDKTGHTFAGWYADEALTTAFDFENTIVTQAITLYAKYEKVVYTITFMNGTEKYKTATASFGDQFAAPDAPTKDGYTFVGWFVDEQGTKEYDFNAAVGGAVTVYAKWQENVNKGCGSIVAVAASAAAAVALLAVAAIALTKKKIVR